MCTTLLAPVAEQHMNLHSFISALIWREQNKVCSNALVLCFSEIENTAYYQKFEYISGWSRTTQKILCILMYVSSFLYSSSNTLLKAKCPYMSVQIHCLLFLLLHCFSHKAEEHPCLNTVCSDEPKWLLLKAAFLYVYDNPEKSYAIQPFLCLLSSILLQKHRWEDCIAFCSRTFCCFRISTV